MPALLRLRSPQRPLLGAGMAVVAAAACWGFGTVATKALLAGFPPLQLLSVQLAASVAFLWAAVALTRAPVRLDRAAALAALSGMLEPGLAHTVGIMGLRLTSASAAALIGASETPMTVLLAALFLGERLGSRALLLVAAAAAGVGLLVLPHAEGLGDGSLLGDGLVATGALLAAGYVTVSRRLVGGFSPLPLAALQQTVALGWTLLVLALAPAAGTSAPGQALGQPTLLTLAEAGATGVVSYAFSFWLYLSGLRRVPASQAALYLTLIPVFGVAGAALALEERLTPLQWVGAAVVIGAVQAMVRAGRRAAAGASA